MIRAVLDANVLVSAVISSGGPCAAILDAWRDARIEIVVSERLLTELEGVLARAKFRSRVSRSQVEEFVAHLRRLAVVAPDVEHPPRACRDPNDDYLFSLAQASADVLVSGDRDLTETPTALPVRTPRQFLDALSEA